MGLLRGLLSGGFLLVFLEQSGCGLCRELGETYLQFLRQLLVRVRQFAAELFLDLAPVLVRDVFGDVGCSRSHNSLRHGVLAHHSGDLRVLNCGHVHGDVRLVVLIHKRLHRLGHHDVHILGDRINRLHVVVHRYQLGSVLDPQHLDHLTV